MSQTSSPSSSFPEKPSSVALSTDGARAVTPMVKGFGFEIVAGSEDGPRVGKLMTPRGIVETPAFMAVATQGSVKGVSPFQLREAGARIMLSNTYHLSVRPGEDCVRELGGLHEFSQWSGPILTDSGGFQVLSLAKLRKMTEKGVTFQSHVDGAKHELTPENVLEIQSTLGSDIAMVLDDCPDPGVDKNGARHALERSTRWAKRASDHRHKFTGYEPMAVFGILQGGAHEDLRKEGAQMLRELDFDGFAIGGVSVGESREKLLATIPWAAKHLPVDRPRYLMGVAGFEEFLQAIRNGVDMFDCVLPTRNARNGHLFRRHGGVIKIKNSRFRRDSGPIEEGCDCECCKNYSRGFVSHLFHRRELLGYTLASIHNLRVFYRFLEDARVAIRKGLWKEFESSFGFN